LKGSPWGESPPGGAEGLKAGLKAVAAAAGVKAAAAGAAGVGLKDGPLSKRLTGAAAASAAVGDRLACAQGLTLVHFSAQRKRFC